MPTVPVYDNATVGRASLQGGQNTTQPDMQALSGGARTANTLSQATGALGAAGERIQERRDLDDAFRAETGVLAEYQTFEADLRKTRRGAAARDITNDVDQWWAKAEEKTTANASPRVQQLLAKSMSRARLNSLEGMGRYQAAEEDRSQTESFTAAQGQEIQTAITSGDPAVIGTARGKIQAAATVFGATRGWTSEQIAAEKQKWANTLHVQAVSALVDGNNPTGAQAYFEANRSEIDSANHARMDKIIKGAVNEQKATDNAAGMATLPFEQQLEKAAKITDPDERKLTVKAIKENVSEKQIADGLREKAASDSIWQMVANGTPLNKLPKTVLERMDGKERVQVNAHFEAQRKAREAEAKGHSIKTDPTELAKVYDMMRDNPDEFKKLRMTTLVDRISGSDMEQIARLQQSMAKPGEDQTHVVSTTQAISTYTKEMSKEQANKFTPQAYKALDDFQIQNKRAPDLEERRKLLDDLTVKGVVEDDTLWFDSTKPRYMMTPEQLAKAKFPGAADKYTVGKVYKDANGNRATYKGDGKWDTTK